MPVNLFDPRCQETPHNYEYFGVCDGINEGIAETDISKEKKWIATVSNKRQHEFTFTAVDHCISLVRPDGNYDKRCDCIITYKDNIVFIELKDVSGNWINNAIEQLATTITYYSKNIAFDQYKKKRAFACNKRRPQFEYSKKEKIQRFYNTYNVRLFIQADIEM
jgi:hypothetical protein